MWPNSDGAVGNVAVATTEERRASGGYGAAGGRHDPNFVVCSEHLVSPVPTSISTILCGWQNRAGVKTKRGEG